MEKGGKVPEGTLVFIWNAKKGWQQAVFDSLHKWISPGSYSCSLCQLTYGFAGPKAEWKSFLASLDRPVHFYHRDEFKDTGIRGGFPEEFPLILERHPGNWHVLMDAQDLEGIPGLDQLLNTLRDKLNPDVSGS